MTSSALALQSENGLRRIAEARSLTDQLFAVVRDDSLYERPIPERHRIVFYIGHLEAFDWNLLSPNAADSRRGSSKKDELDRLFAFGIDPVDGGLPKDQPEHWPGLATVREYIAQTRSAVDGLLSSGKFPRSGTEQTADLQTLVHVASEHRLMHAETLAYLFHQLRYSAKRNSAEVNELATALLAQSPELGQTVEIPAGVAALGLQHNEGSFGWDNEFEAHDVFVPPFAIDKYMVTNGQFLEFLNAGGYQNATLWGAEDWRWREQNQVEHPVWWSRRGGEWFYRGMFDEVRLPRDWPVYLSHAEAVAYANWAHKRLPTEAEWHRAAYGAPDGSSCAAGRELAPATHGNFDFRRWEPEPVSAHQETNQSAFGVVGMLGNGWEWTSSEFAPFPGFRPFSFYPGYSANFFDGKHFVMKGGSARTAAALLRPSFRNWFQTHYQYMYAGFRCVTKPTG